MPNTVPAHRKGREAREKIDILATLLYDEINPDQEITIKFSKAFCIRAVERLLDLQDEFGIAPGGFELVDVLVDVFRRAEQ